MLRTALCCILIAATMPATLMGSTTYFFINENPDYSDELAEGGEDPVWQAEIIEIESDSAISAPDGYEETDTAYIHGIGLLAPSELVAQTGTYSDWHYDFWHNRYWGSTITTSYADPQHLFKRVQVQSVTGRYTIPGVVAVNDSTICPQLQGGGWFPGWKSAWGWRIFWANSWSYGSGYTKTWTQIGWHNWNGPDFLRTRVGPITW
jgi:hypothetical protein